MGASRRPPSPGGPGTFEGAVVPQQLQEPLLREDPGAGPRTPIRPQSNAGLGGGGEGKTRR